MTSPRPDALILCGGEASRLGGIDKPLRELAERRLIERVVSVAATQAGRILISANRNAETYAHFGQVLGDGEFAGFGPLAGLVAGLGIATSAHLLCLPGDAPNLPPGLVEGFETARLGSKADITYVFDGLGPQPLCCLVRRELRDDLIDYLRAGGRTPREWFKRHHCVAADFSAHPAWSWSINTEDEWQRAEQQLTRPTLAS